MDLIEEKPRQHPKPVPFFQVKLRPAQPVTQFIQDFLAQPTVPEVSLLLQENTDTQLRKNDSFSGTEFQTYNSWRWKHMNSHKNCDYKTVNKLSNEQDCFLIRDKYCTSDIEKRKNEILYGEAEEPRRPLPPRPNPDIPTCIQSFFSNTSFDDFKSRSSPLEKQQKPPSPVSCPEVNVGHSYPSQLCFLKDSNNSQKLYNIISEQNKQLHILQDQIQQLLKLQDVKDKQIEQLLKSQESKEKKIEQLLQSLDVKGHEIQHLTELKEKQEVHIQELKKSQEIVQKENFNLLKKLNEARHKEMQTVGIMACIPMTDAETSTDLDGIIRQFSCQSSDNTVENISIIRESSKCDEKSLSLHSSDLPVIQENVPTPQSSIHVDIQDFPDSSDDSECETGIPSNSLTDSKDSQSNHLGYTFYNNVLTQLKDIIHNSEERGNGKSENHEKYTEQVLEENCVQEFNRSIKSASNGQEKNERFLDKHQTLNFKDSNSPSDVSLKINALALKYLKKEQISELGLQPSIPTAFQHDVTIYNVTNLSFGSLRYLDRYQMLPEVKQNQRCMINVQKGETSPSEFLCRKKKLTIEKSIMPNSGNVLDMSTLNQQPKFL